MRLHFNSVLLHRMLVANNVASFATDIADVTGVCFSSALSVLRQTIKMGKMNILYYLWDTAHLMAAYAAMMIPKLLRQASNASGVSKREALNVLAEVTTILLTAANSLESPRTSSQVSSGTVSVENALSAQARLLSAILARLLADTKEQGNDPFSQDTVDPLPASALPWIQNRFLDDTLPLGVQQPEAAGFSASRSNHSQDNAPEAPRMNEEFDLMLNNDLIDSRYMDVGFLSWDEPGIFVDPH